MRTFSITDIGMVRKMNQDYIFCSNNPIGSLSNLFLVADGMGGHNAGDYASKCCVENMIAAIEHSNLKSPISILEQALQKANTAVYETAERNEELQGMGTTIVAATILGTEMYIANVGDSRAYLIREYIHQITEDHSWVETMIQKGELDRKDARLHEKKNVITRAIGMGPVVQADFFEISLEEGDMLTMCTDGLSNMVADEDIYDIIKSSGNIESAGKELIRTANANGGKDNIGLILVQI